MLYVFISELLKLFPNLESQQLLCLNFSLNLSLCVPRLEVPAFYPAYQCYCFPLWVFCFSFSLWLKHYTNSPSPPCSCSNQQGLCLGLFSHYRRCKTLSCSVHQLLSWT